MNLSLSTKTKDLIERAGWTFVQTFLSVFVLPPVAQMGNLPVWKSAVLAAAAAGVSAVKTGLKNSKPTV